MTDDLAARRARHHPDDFKLFGAVTPCQACGQLWGDPITGGCDAAVAFAALRAQAGQADPHADLSTPAIAQRAPFAYGQWRVDLTTLLDRVQAAEAALAAILTVDRPYVLWERVQHMEAIARQALAEEE